jgi:hypothetical protein
MKPAQAGFLCVELHIIVRAHVGTPLLVQEQIYVSPLKNSLSSSPAVITAYLLMVFQF